MLRALGVGLITGAADDDPSAIGTYASAGARLGTSFLWTAPLTLPMMFTVVYLSSKLGQVAGQGLFFAGLNPMKALVWSGIVQGFSTPPLLLLIMIVTNRRSVMGDRVNGTGLNLLGWATTCAVFAATVGLVITWIY